MRLSSFSPVLPALVMLLATVVDAQQSAPALSGRWEGTLIPKTAKKAASKQLGSTGSITKLAVVVAIAAASDGTLSGTWVASGQQAVPVEIAIDGDTIRFTMPATMASWQGKLSADGSTLDGKWQGKTFGGDATARLILDRSGS